MNNFYLFICSWRSHFCHPSCNSVFILWYKVIQCLSTCLWDKNVVLINYYSIVGCFFKQLHKNEWCYRKALTSPVIFPFVFVLLFFQMMQLEKKQTKNLVSLVLFPSKFLLRWCSSWLSILLHRLVTWTEYGKNEATYFHGDGCREQRNIIWHNATGTSDWSWWCRSICYWW